jgi:hypothetical protein
LATDTGQGVAFLQRPIRRRPAAWPEGGTALICYLLMTRWQNRRANSGSSDQLGPDGGDGWSIFTWFGGGNSAEDSPGNPGDPVRSDSGGGD